MDADLLVGRRREREILRRHLAAALAGSGSIVLVDGDAGVGKTALAGWLIGHARAVGVRVAWGACLEGEGAGPYRPWTQVLKDLRRSAALLLDPANHDADSRFQLFAEIAERLRADSQDNGLLMVLDDLHWADVGSLRLLHAVAADLAGSRLLVVGLYRGREALPYATNDEQAGLVRAVLRERSSTQLSLGGLSSHEVIALAQRAHGQPLDHRLLRDVQARSEGNPLFVLELLRLVDASGRLDTGLPRTIRELIGRRLEPLPPATRALMRQAAVLGREFTTTLLGSVVDADPDALLNHLDAAKEAQLVSVLNPYTLRFAHVLTQEVLYAELSTAERQRLHARAAEALASAGGVTAVPDQLAHHLRQAAPLGSAAEALAVTRAAARRAHSQLAYEHAVFQFREALQLLPMVRGGTDERAGLLLELARCEFRSGAVEDAWRSCREAADVGRAVGDPRVVADAATIVRGITNSTLTAQIHALCREALALLGGKDDVREARLLAQLAITTDPFSTSESERTGQRALQAAEASGDIDARFLAMQALQAELVAPAHVLKRLSIGERAVRLGRTTGNEEYVAWGHTWRITAFWELSRRVQLDGEVAAFAGTVAHLREPLWQWRLTMLQASLAAFEGRFDDARSCGQKAAVLARRDGHDDTDFFHLVLSTHLALQTGDGLDAAVDGVRAYVENGPYLARTWLAEVLLGAGRREEAEEMWHSVLPHLSAFPSNSKEWIVAAIWTARMSVQFEDRAVATWVYNVLLPFADRQAIALNPLPSSGPVALSLGMLARYMDDAEAAETHLGSALAVSRSMGSPPYEATTRLELARLEAGRRPHGVQSDAHLEQAVTIARRIGMAPLLAEVAALAEARQRDHLVALSVREDQVAALVAEGLSNRQIAARLQLSERTAENHVAHILTKLGFDSRVRIAAWYSSRRPRP